VEGEGSADSMLLRDEQPSTQRFRSIIVAVLFPFLILLANFLIVRRLFRVEFTQYLQTTEGLFIAIAKGVATHPRDLIWWPLWDLGVPFQNTYAPLLPIMAGLYSIATGFSAPLSMHQLSAAAYCFGPVVLYYMAWAMTRRAGASFLAVLAYSAVSPCLWFFTTLSNDAGGAWNLRRLHILVYYGESPHTVSLMLIPLALLFLYLAIDREPFWPQVGAGIAIGAAVLTNTFAAVIMVLACVCLLSTFANHKFWKYLGFLCVLGVLTYAWISPLSPPSVMQAIRENSPTVDGDYRFTSRSFIGAVALAVGFLVLRWALRKALRELQFFWLLTFLMFGIISLGVWGKVYVVPQPHRYQIMFDMMFSLAVVFSFAEWMGTRTRRLWGIGVVLFLALVVVLRHDVRYGRGLIRAADIRSTQVYRVAQWFNEHLPGRRVMMSGSYSLFFNIFSDSPQMLGGADTMLPNFTMRVAGFIVYSGLNAGARDAEISTLWLQSMGVRAVLVPGLESEEIFKPFANPKKFDGVLPVLWREKDDTVYEVPASSVSLAHVIPEVLIVHDPPNHGLDVGEIEKYVAALNDTTLPEASFEWVDRHTARIRARVESGQALSVQVTYHPGWRTSDGAIQKDGLGLILLRPACRGDCEVTLTYDGGRELRLAEIASISTMVGVIIFGCLRWKRAR
jgi:hypothetical protein